MIAGSITWAVDGSARCLNTRRGGTRMRATAENIRAFLAGKPVNRVA